LHALPATRPRPSPKRAIWRILSTDPLVNGVVTARDAMPMHREAIQKPNADFADGPQIAPCALTLPRSKSKSGVSVLRPREADSSRGRRFQNSARCGFATAPIDAAICGPSAKSALAVAVPALYPARSQFIPSWL
jgi:hypothetical protein